MCHIRKALYVDLDQEVQISPQKLHVLIWKSKNISIITIGAWTFRKV